MLGEHQSVVPNFTYYPNPNLSPHPNSQTTDSASYEHAGGVMGVTSNVSPVAGNFGVMTQPMMNIIQPVQCEICNVICNTENMLEKHKQGKKHLKNQQKVAESYVITPQIPPPSDANAPTVGQLENKKLMLLKNGASVNTLISCDICNVVCNNQDGFRAHVAGKKHSAKAGIQAANTNGLLDPTSASQNKPDNTYHCEICKVSCTSNELLGLHLVGKKHQKKLKESEQNPLASLVTPSAKPLENREATEGNTVISQEGKPVSCELCGISCTSYEVLRTHISGKKHQKNLEISEKPVGPNPAAPVTELAPEVTPLVIEPHEQDSVKEEGKIVSKKKMKRGKNHVDAETKKQKISEGDGTLDAQATGEET